MRRSLHKDVLGATTCGGPASTPPAKERERENERQRERGGKAGEGRLGFRSAIRKQFFWWFSTPFTTREVYTPFSHKSRWSLAKRKARRQEPQEDKLNQADLPPNAEPSAVGLASSDHRTMRRAHAFARAPCTAAIQPAPFESSQQRRCDSDVSPLRKPGSEGWGCSCLRRP